MFLPHYIIFLILIWLLLRPVLFRGHKLKMLYTYGRGCMYRIEIEIDELLDNVKFASHLTISIRQHVRPRDLHHNPRGDQQQEPQVPCADFYQFRWSQSRTGTKHPPGFNRKSQVFYFVQYRV